MDVFLAIDSNHPAVLSIQYHPQSTHNPFRSSGKRDQRSFIRFHEIKSRSQSIRDINLPFLSNTRNASMTSSFVLTWFMRDIFGQLASEVTLAIRERYRNEYLQLSSRKRRKANSFPLFNNNQQRSTMAEVRYIDNCVRFRFLLKERRDSICLFVDISQDRFVVTNELDCVSISCLFCRKEARTIGNTRYGTSIEQITPSKSIPMIYPTTIME